MDNFYTSAIVTDPRFNSTACVSALELLEPVMRQKVDVILAAALAQGVELMVFETYRSQGRQAALFAAGATQLSKVGVHHYGLACDLVRKVQGEPSWKGDFSIVGSLARANGLIWGGDWGHPGRPSAFVDAVHVQRCTVGRQQQLFDQIWYPDLSYDPYRDALL